MMFSLLLLDRGKKGFTLGKIQIYLILISVMTAWGFNVVATKVLVENFMPVTMTAARIFVAGIVVFIILFVMKKVRKLTKKEWVVVLVGSLFNVVGHHYFLAVGLTETSASNGGLILGIGPLLTAIMAIVFLGNRLTWIRVLGFLLGIIGVSFIVLQGGEGLSGISFGDLYVFLSVFMQALSFIMINKVSHSLDPRLMTGYMLVMGSIILFGISLILEPSGIHSMFQPTSTKIWVVFFASAIVATAFGQMLYNYSIGKVGAAEASIFINLNPFFALVGAVLFLGEKIGLTHIVGFIFILFGVLFGSGAMEEIIRKKNEKKSLKVTQGSIP